MNKSIKIRMDRTPPLKRERSWVVEYDNDGEVSTLHIEEDYDVALRLAKNQGVQRQIPVLEENGQGYWRPVDEDEVCDDMGLAEDLD